MLTLKAFHPISHSSETSQEPKHWYLHLQIHANQERILFFFIFNSFIECLSVWHIPLFNGCVSQVRNEWKNPLFWLVHCGCDTQTWFQLGWASDWGDLVKFDKINQESSEVLEKQLCLRKKEIQSWAGGKRPKSNGPGFIEMNVIDFRGSSSWLGIDLIN